MGHHGFPFYFPFFCLHFSIVIFTQAEEKKKFFVSTMGSVVTQPSCTNRKNDHKRVFIISLFLFHCLLNVDRFQKVVFVAKFSFLSLADLLVDCLTRFHKEMSLNINCLINISILNHWRSMATNYYSFHQL